MDRKDIKKMNTNTEKVEIFTPIIQYFSEKRF